MFLLYSDPTVANCSFSGNVASGGPDVDGGGLCCVYSAPNLTECTFEDNHAPLGGAVHTRSHDVATRFYNCTFMVNDAEGGGGIYADEADVTLEDCHLEGNAAYGSESTGGGLALSAALGSVTHCTFHSNSSDYRGGAISVSFGGSVLADDSDFVSNSAQEGGAIRGSTTTLLSLTDCRFDSNSSIGEGGAIVCASPGTVVQGCLFANNEAEMGAGIRMHTGTLTLSGSSLVNNTATSSGGAIRLGECNPIVTSCTFAGNGAPEGSSFYNSGSIEFPVENTIIAFGTGGLAVDGFGAMPTFGCTDIYGNAGGDWAGRIADQYGIEGNISEDPLFCGAQNPEDPYSIEAGSPCAASHNPQCGLIGAHEVGCGSVSGVGWDGDLPSRIQLSGPYPSPAADGVSIGYAMPGHSAGLPVTVRIIDAQGRFVRTLVDDVSTGGRSKSFWDCRAEGGCRAETGVYYCQLRIGNEQLVQRILIVR